MGWLDDGDDPPEKPVVAVEEDDDDDKPKARAIARRPAFEPPERFLGESELDYRSRAFCLRLAFEFTCCGPVQFIDIFDYGWRLTPGMDYWAAARDVAVWYDFLQATHRRPEKPDPVAPPPPAPRPVREETRAPAQRSWW